MLGRVVLNINGAQLYLTPDYNLDYMYNHIYPAQGSFCLKQSHSVF